MAEGRCYREGSRVIIEIDPDLEPADYKFETFLHECAHARLHAPHMPDHLIATDYRQMYTDEFIKANKQKNEDAADELMNAWYAWSLVKQRQDSTMDRLLALLHYPGG